MAGTVVSRLSPKRHEGVSFLGLARELQDQIYEICLRQSPLRFITPDEHWECRSRNATARGAPDDGKLEPPIADIPRTCRQTFDEFRGLYFKNLEIDTMISYIALYMQHLNSLIPKSFRPCVRELTMGVHGLGVSWKCDPSEEENFSTLCI